MSKRMPLVVTVSVMLLLASSCTAPTNHEPIITSLDAELGRVIPSASCQIVCTATDPDGDELTYSWSSGGGEINGEGATIAWTAPVSEGSYSITVIVTDGQSGAVSDYVVIMVRVNNPPVIGSLVADPIWTTSSGSIQATCNASDPDGDELSYEWLASGGVISGTGPEVTWTAPEDTDVCNITVVVKDGHGSSDTRILSVIVTLEEPPTIEDLIVTADHCYLKEYSWGYKVGREQEYQIECILSDNSTEVSYQWSCEDGTISGEGSMITWTTPDEYIETTTVTAVVSGMVYESVVFEVVSCSPCTFGC